MKMLPQKANRIFLVLLAAALLLTAVGAGAESTPLVGAGLTAAFGAFVFRALTFRCPFCGHYLGRTDGTHCPRCKKEFS